MSWDTSTSQIHHRSNHLTLSENKNENFQSIEKHRENKYTCSFSFTQAFLLVLVPEYDGVSWKHRPCHPLRIKKLFCYLHLTRHLLILIYLSSWDFEFLALRFCRCLTYLKQDVLYDLLYATSAWQTWQVRFHFFLILFHYWAAFVVYQQKILLQIP